MAICTFQSGDFDVMIKDKETGREIFLSGNQKITKDQLDFINDVAPACVWTDYTRTTPAD
jgi:hypothetical protein